MHALICNTRVGVKRWMSLFYIVTIPWLMLFFTNVDEEFDILKLWSFIEVFSVVEYDALFIYGSC